MESPEIEKEVKRLLRTDLSASNVNILLNRLFDTPVYKVKVWRNEQSETVLTEEATRGLICGQERHRDNAVNSIYLRLLRSKVLSPETVHNVL